MTVKHSSLVINLTNVITIDLQTASLHDMDRSSLLHYAVIREVNPITINTSHRTKGLHSPGSMCF